MGVKISAVQAALLIGRNERRVRDWIATRRLPAIKAGHTWQIDTEDLERIPGIKIDREQLALLQVQQGCTLPGLLGRISELEQTVENLQVHVNVLNAQVTSIELLLSGQANDMQRLLETFQPGGHSGNPQAPAATTTENAIEAIQDHDSESLPTGSIRVKQFALTHKVPAAVLAYQIETGKIEDTALSMANGRKAHWFTPQQQESVILFWRRNGTHFIPCSSCPHHISSPAT
jgi:hypothetical protein